MKTLFRAMFLTMMVAMTAPAFAADTVPVTASVETKEQKLERLENRLNEIKAMDFDNMSRSEKRELKGEVRQIKKEMKAVSGVYISVGALLIIILLIVLLA